MIWGQKDVKDEKHIYYDVYIEAIRVELEYTFLIKKQIVIFY